MDMASPVLVLYTLCELLNGHQDYSAINPWHW